ncbi:hypothetical protein V6N13_004712 [Hibiscus sabdariffa]
MMVRKDKGFVTLSWEVFGSGKSIRSSSNRSIKIDPSQGHPIVLSRSEGPQSATQVCRSALHCWTYIRVSPTEKGKELGCPIAGPTSDCSARRFDLP